MAPHRPGCREKPTCGAQANEAMRRETTFAARHGAKARARAEVRARAAAWANDSKIGRATRPVNGSANDVAKARDPAPADKAGAEEAGTPETMCGARHGAEARGVANSSDKRTEVRMSAPEHFHLHHKGAPVGHSRTKPDA